MMRIQWFLVLGLFSQTCFSTVFETDYDEDPSGVTYGGQELPIEMCGGIIKEETATCLIPATPLWEDALNWALPKILFGRDILIPNAHAACTGMKAPVNAPFARTADFKTLLEPMPVQEGTVQMTGAGNHTVKENDYAYAKKIIKWMKSPFKYNKGGFNISLKKGVVGFSSPKWRNFLNEECKPTEPNYFVNIILQEIETNDVLRNLFIPEEVYLAGESAQRHQQTMLREGLLMMKDFSTFHRVEWSHYLEVWATEESRKTGKKIVELIELRKEALNQYRMALEGWMKGQERNYLKFETPLHQIVNSPGMEPDHVWVTKVPAQSGLEKYRTEHAKIYYAKIKRLEELRVECRKEYDALTEGTEAKPGFMSWVNSCAVDGEKCASDHAARPLHAWDEEYRCPAYDKALAL